MLTFNIVDMGDYYFRCVLGGESYFDFSVAQLDMFGYEHFFENLQDSVGSPIYDVKEDRVIGDLVAVRHLKAENSIWILSRNGIRGELFVKELL